MADIDKLSRRIPQLCKVAPSTQLYHMEDVHRAGGVMAILGELNRAGLIDASTKTVHSDTMGEALLAWDIITTESDAVKTMYAAGPAGIPTQTAFSQDTRWPSLDIDREGGCIRALEHAYSLEGGLAVLFGNIAEDGCVVKTAGVDDDNLTFSGPAHICESQEDAVAALGDGLEGCRDRPVLVVARLPLAAIGLKGHVPEAIPPGEGGGEVPVPQLLRRWEWQRQVALCP